MDGFELTASLVSSLMWPAVAVTCAVLFRKQIAETILPHFARLKSAKLPGSELNFSDQVETVQKALVEAPVPVPPALPSETENPVTPIMRINKDWVLLSEWVREASRKLNIDSSENAPVIALMKELVHKSTTKDKETLFRVFENFYMLLEDARSHPFDLSQNDADRFVGLTRLLRAYLINPWEESAERP